MKKKSIPVVLKNQLLVLATVLMAWTNTTCAQAVLDKKYGEKVKTLDSTIATLYSVISGEKGEERDWELFRYLYYPRAQMVASGKNPEGQVGARYLTPGEYISNSGDWLLTNGFFEDEIHRTTEQFGPIAHVFSTYETFHSRTEAESFMRGINSIQLLYTGERWWVMNIFWTQETEENPIPKEYLPN
ncbi:hypothetical protein [Flagellimonas olearia]|uniref:Nuclear transport factor 2 family protein n=1 Tax=Flagellimonas olearia TaxID=552546 RepID=A0A444VJP2_9FLAO|nr:hypothetical protein [Allomuricauda olearia]RYC50983.1 hypothetical protein DN53_15190 [Allomuricauda olearia]